MMFPVVFIRASGLVTGEKARHQRPQAMNAKPEPCLASISRGCVRGGGGERGGGRGNGAL